MKIWDWWARFWARISAARYVRGLEVEVARLRGENRALLNSILGIAGVPPITVAEMGIELGELGLGGEDGGETSGAAKKGRRGGAGSVPMRRRSWQQINRMLEFQSTRKTEKNGDDPVVRG